MNLYYDSSLHLPHRINQSEIEFRDLFLNFCLCQVTTGYGNLKVDDLAVMVEAPFKKAQEEYLQV